MGMEISVQRARTQSYGKRQAARLLTSRNLSNIPTESARQRKDSRHTYRKIEMANRNRLFQLLLKKVDQSRFCMCRQWCRQMKDIRSPTRPLSIAVAIKVQSRSLLCASSMCNFTLDEEPDQLYDDSWRTARCPTKEASRPGLGHRPGRV